MDAPLDPPSQSQVITGSRLHFGLIRVGKGQTRFGGLGLMIADPATSLRARDAESWDCSGSHCERVLAFAKSFVAQSHLKESISRGVQFEVNSAASPHSGLGSGTQLTLAVAAALYALAGQALPSPRQFAIETGRGKRSAIGCHGFYQGGLLFEGGKEENSPLSELQCRVDFPPQWRVVLIRATELEGVAGPREGQFFEEAPLDQDRRSERMTRLARETLIPAAFEADFAPFSSALYEYGRLAGECFAFAQGDVFAHPQTRRRVEDLQGRGVVGVGQSSWGPTIFALLETTADAESLVCDLKTSPLYGECEIRISAARNEGAEISSRLAVHSKPGIAAS